MRRLVLLLTTLFPLNCIAQNLVANPGLDFFITCPGFGQFSNTYITDWSKPTIGSSDYYNYNCPGINPTQEFPYDGEAYAGIIAYNYGTEYREYITGQLTTPLVAGQVYEVEFYCSLHNNYIQAIEELGAYLSATFPGPVSNTLHLPLVPQIINTGGALSDTSGWEKVSGTFTANGGEQYITIGNFNDDSTTSITQPYFIGSYGAYYFIDGVSVKLLNTSGVIEPAATGWSWQILNDAIVVLSEKDAVTNVILTDITGRVVNFSRERGTSISLETGNIPPGTYLLTAEFKSGNRQSAKIILSRN